jgi:hypothetical protein
MLNPFGTQKDLGWNSYMDLKKRMFQRLQSAKVNDQIFEAVQKAYEGALISEQIVLSRLEKKRLLSQILKMVLEDMLKKLDDSKRV